MRWCDGKNKWTWGCAQRTEENHCGEPMEIYLEIPSAGTHTVSFSMHEDGFAFDQFLLTKDRDYHPSAADKGEFVLASLNDLTAEPKALVFWKRALPDRTMLFPKDEFVKGTLTSQGFDSKKLYSALKYFKGHCKADRLREIVIIRNGICVFEGSNTSEMQNIWSCSKSFTSTAVGLLIDEGKCELDTKAASICEELRELYPDATLRHFTTMTSGYRGKGRGRWNDENSDSSWTPYVPDTHLFAPGTAYASGRHEPRCEFGSQPRQGFGFVRIQLVDVRKIERHARHTSDGLTTQAD